MAFLWKMICNLGDPMSLHHPVVPVHINHVIDMYGDYIVNVFQTFYTGVRVKVYNIYTHANARMNTRIYFI